jgi:hypothetical protein
MRCNRQAAAVVAIRALADSCTAALCRGTCTLGQQARTPHLPLSKQRDGLAQLAQHAPHIDVVGGHHRGLHLAPQLNLLHQLLLPPHMLRTGLPRGRGSCMRLAQPVGDNGA